MKTILRPIESIMAPPPSHFVGDGFKVHNFIPGRIGMHRMSPFLMLDYNAPCFFEATTQPLGVGVHPHRGFETVTIAYQGKVEHHDSSGGGGVIAQGDVQWMTAASGVLHKEFHESVWAAKGGMFQMVQLWVNLPAADKMSKPKYQAIAKQQIPVFNLEGGKVEVIAGKFENTIGAATTFTPLHLYNITLSKGNSCTVNVPELFNTALLVIEGSVVVNQSSINEHHFVLFKNEPGQIIIKANSDVTVLFLSGQIIDEPIAAHGPFVMNTQQELIQAFDDFNNGLFGKLADD
jgi:redox-sensitive bicupin YhaK (pirin superfamily)